ncbi:MAG: hypothetical protein M3290_12440, partial [Actinomycetota bacterium]|nr:hypothetical protein [Actinomycetota bacterium]
ADMVSGARLLERAAALLPGGSPERLSHLADSCEALLATGRAGEIGERARRGIEEARAAEDRCAEARLRLWQLMVDEAVTPDEPPVNELETLDETLTECGDDPGIAQVREALAHIAWITNDADRAITNMQKGLVAAYRAQARTLLSRMAVSYLTILTAGPLAVRDALARFEGVGPIAQLSSFVEIALKANAALLFALDGHFDVARLSLADAEAIQVGLMQPPWVARIPRTAALIELAAGDPGAAFQRASEDLDDLLSIAHPAGIDAAAVAARALCASQRPAEALAIAERALVALSEVTASEAPETSPGELHALRARALAPHSRAEAIDAISESDASPPAPVRLVQAADRLVDVAVANAALGDASQARARLQEAIGLYEGKGATVLSRRARDILESGAKNL